MNTAHSRIGPSRSPLIMNCAGSVQAEDRVGRPPAGEAAIHGSQLHAEAEDCLRNNKKSSNPVVALYLDAVRRIAARADVTPQIEVRIDCSRYHRELYGTADALIIDLAWHVLTIVDFKSGLHHVDASSLQLQLYGAMAFMSLPAALQQQIRWIDTCIVQPTNGSTEPVRQIRHTVADVVRTLDAYVEIAWIATDDADPPRTAGSWCRAHFCAARTTCPVFRALVVSEAQAEFTADADGGASS